jgi:hypothetical protein
MNIKEGGLEYDEEERSSLLLYVNGLLNSTLSDSVTRFRLRNK